MNIERCKSRGVIKVLLRKLQFSYLIFNTFSVYGKFLNAVYTIQRRRIDINICLINEEITPFIEHIWIK